jgi:hypothetical protein
MINLIQIVGMASPRATLRLFLQGLDIENSGCISKACSLFLDCIDYL